MQLVLLAKSKASLSMPIGVLFRSRVIPQLTQTIDHRAGMPCRETNTYWSN